MKGVVIILWLLIVVKPAWANEVRNVELLASSCSACHGTKGHSINDIPVLAGMSKVIFIQKMTTFQSGDKTATVMHQHAVGYLPTEIELLADFFSTQ